jgi:hypothetical protein
MPFEWCHPDVPPSFADAGPKAAVMYERELRDRAALLLRLGFSRVDAKRRLRGNVRWDFELHGSPPHLGKVEPIVDEVYAARRAGGGGPPSL